MILLSPPDVGSIERQLVLDAFDSGWIAPLGPMVDRFEAEFAELVGAPAAAALSSGTAALHLGLLLAGVGRGDDVVVPTLTFVATANAVSYLGANPVFIDSELDTWNMNPELLEEFLVDRAARGALPAAVITVDLYGQCAQYDRLVAICERFDIPIVEDAAEALGAQWQGKPAGSFGQSAAFSFNGNKIMTTSGGGMLVGSRRLMDKARALASQARLPVLHYEHEETGYNYRLSNLLAAVGVGQLQRFEGFLDRRQRNRELYENELGHVEGLTFMPHHPDGVPNNWLTAITIERGGVEPSELCRALADAGVEARPIWKPMHLQPLFAQQQMVGGAVSEAIFANGICLPSGSVMTDDDVNYVADALRSLLGV